MTEESASAIQKPCQPIISAGKALTTINLVVTEDHIIPLKDEFIHVKDALGRILSEKVISNNDMPPFLTATKQEYAVMAHEEIIEEMNTDEVSCNTNAYVQRVRSINQNFFQSSEINPTKSDDLLIRRVDKEKCIPLGTQSNLLSSYINSFITTN